MHFDVETRTASMGVGEFAGFCTGPRESGEGAPQGIWRAQLGTQWHTRLRAELASQKPHARFEIPIEGGIFHRGWTLTLSGRIDQLVPESDPATCHLISDMTRGQSALLREIKTVTAELPAGEAGLRRDYPEYFVQLACYAALRNLATGSAVTKAELVFVETGSGLSQAVPLSRADDALFRAKLEEVVGFLESRRLARLRLRSMRFRPAFAHPRSGQETTRADLDRALTSRPGPVLFEAPTGFGKTGVLLESALGLLREGHFDRVIYLTSKSTGQLQVVRTLASMTEVCPPGADKPLIATRSVAPWHVRPKSEHCVNHTFQCVRERCVYLDGIAGRWPGAGLSRFWLDGQVARDLGSVREAGRAAQVCPYEITRVALAHSDVWIGDYNYVFSPSSRTLFLEQPGFDAARTLLLIDEAHNLPARVADAHSHAFSGAEARDVLSDLARIRAPQRLHAAWDRWCHFLGGLKRCDSLTLDAEDDARQLLSEAAEAVAGAPADPTALSPGSREALWSLASAAGLLDSIDVPRLWWCPAGGDLAVTCLDAATVIEATLAEFGGVVFSSATFGPPGTFAGACGLAAIRAESLEPARAAPPERLGVLTKRDTRKLYTRLTSAAELLRVEEAAASAAPIMVRAMAPWREGAYRIAIDTRVDTTFQHRSRHFMTTAGTAAALRQASSGPVAAFFPSHAYAEAVREMAAAGHALRVAIQPRLMDLASQAAWIEEALDHSDALFLVLGSSFAESIDLLGGRIGHAMVVGPALPEVNSVQQARMAALTARGTGRIPLARAEAFRQVYQIPGMTKVNQALGRLVRAPGHRTAVLLHCRRFASHDYAALLAPEYSGGTILADEPSLEAWAHAGFPSQNRG